MQVFWSYLGVNLNFNEPASLLTTWPVGSPLAQGFSEGPGTRPWEIQLGSSEILPEGPMDPTNLENLKYISMEGPTKIKLGALENLYGRAQGGVSKTLMSS